MGEMSPWGRYYILCGEDGVELWSHISTNDDWAKIDLIRGERTDKLNAKYGVGGWFVRDAILEVL